MADSRFFKKSRAFTLAELAGLIGAELADVSSGSYSVEDVAALDQAGAKDLAFLDNIRYKAQFSATKAGACIVHPDLTELAPKGLHLLLSPQPYKSYALAAQAFYPSVMPEAQVHAGAFIHPEAKLGAGVRIDAGAVIEKGAVIGEGCWIEAHATIGESVELGEHCRIGVSATLSHCLVGAHTRIYPGARIGQDGFGFAIDPKGHVKVPQLGRVVIGHHVEIGANTCIDRGAGPDTVIGDGTWVDNLVQIGHNVKIGRGCIIVSQVGISGSTVIDDFVAIGGQAGLAGHLHIGKGARIAAQSGIMRDIPPGEEQMGYPALPIKQYMKQVALMKRLIKKDKV